MRRARVRSAGWAVLFVLLVGALAASAAAAPPPPNQPNVLTPPGGGGGGCASGSNTYQGITVSYSWCWNGSNVLTSVSASANQPQCWGGCSQNFSSGQPNVSTTSGGVGSTFAQIRVYGTWALEANIAWDAYLAGLGGPWNGLPTVENVYIYVRMNGGSSSPGVSATSDEE